MHSVGIRIGEDAGKLVGERHTKPAQRTEEDLRRQVRIAEWRIAGMNPSFLAFELARTPAQRSQDARRQRQEQRPTCWAGDRGARAEEEKPVLHVGDDPSAMAISRNEHVGVGLRALLDEVG